MRITCLIDSLGSGGAQRQMTRLIRALKVAGYDVQLLVYHDLFMHFLPDLAEIGVQPICIQWSSKLDLIRKTRKQMRAGNPDLIVSFLSTPNILAILSSLGIHRIPVIVSERSLNIGKPDFRTVFRFNLYRFSSHVVTNSQAQADFIQSNFPFLAPKTSVIRNCVDLDQFHPSSRPASDNVRIVVAASVTPVKNAIRLIQAVHEANQVSERRITVDWFGNNLFASGKPTDGSKYFLDAQKLLVELNATDEFVFHSTVSDLHSRICEYDALCLPSLYEGCPNIVCEAMASGLPVLVSRVSDLATTIGDKEMTFDPYDVQSISQALLRFACSSDNQQSECGKRNRRYAEEHFSPDRFGSEFCRLIESVHTYSN